MPLAALVFMSGVIALLVGAVRGVAAIRAAIAGAEDRLTLPAVAWSAVSLYGLVLASAGMLLAR